MNLRLETMTKKIRLKWNTKKIEDKSRIGVEYCFKSCLANPN